MGPSSLRKLSSVVIDRIPAWANEMLRTARVGRLGLIDDHDTPRVLPVTYALAGGSLYSAIDKKPKRSADPARLRFLQRRPEAALTVDHYEDDWTALAWVQVLGRIEIVPAEEDPAALAALAAKYAPYRDEPPPGPLLKLVPVRTLCWRADEG
jgi:PPOX class probable F420-dependent enzyme